MPLQPKTFELLVHLVTRAGTLQTKQQLLDEVWGKVVVTENSLTRSIHQLRAALDDTADEPRFVETVPRVGYRFIAPVTREETPPATAVAHDEPPPPRRRFVASLVALVALAAAGIIGYFVADRFMSKRPPSQPSPSIAVLPFKNISNDPANTVLADGIAETLLTMLAQIDELRVIGRTSSFSFRDKDVDLRTIGQVLGAGAILEGSVQRSGERLRINAQLINAADGVHLWAEHFDRPITDVFAIQDEIARRVAEALHVTLAGKRGLGSVGTQNFEAYELYLEASQLQLRRQTASNPVVIAKLERAIALDPEYASAWTLLAIARLSSTGPLDAALEAARRAVELAPEEAGGHFALGTIMMYAGMEGAADELARALELNPHDPWALAGVANEYRQRAGRFAEGAALMRRAVNLDPRNFAIRVQAAFSFEANADLPGALAELHEAIRLEPGMAFAYHTTGEMLFGVLGRSDDALRFMSRARVLDPEDAHEGVLAIGYGLIGEDDRAQRELASMRPLLGSDEFLALRAQLDFGREAAARELLEQALNAQPPSTVLLVKVDALGLTTAQDTALRVLGRLRDIDADWIERATRLDEYPPICTLAWSGDRAGAAALLVPWERRLRPQLPYTMATGAQHRGTWLARGLACTGRNEEALAELEKLISEKYHAGGSRALAADRAYDAIRGEPRFKALLERLRSVEETERRQFLERPDLDDSDIEALAAASDRSQ